MSTLWARALKPDVDDRCLYLRGAPRPDTVPYGLSTLLASGSRTEARDLLLVEGVVDVHILRAHAIDNVAALGGTATSSRLLQMRILASLAVAMPRALDDLSAADGGQIVEVVIISDTARHVMRSYREHERATPSI